MLILRLKKKIHFKLNLNRDLTISRVQMWLTNFQMVVFNIMDAMQILRGLWRRIVLLLKFTLATPTSSGLDILSQTRRTMLWVRKLCPLNQLLILPEKTI